MSCDAKAVYDIVVFTGTRAEYGLLRPVLQKLAANGRFSLRLAVTGAHLSAEQGGTLSEIEADGFEPDVLLPILDVGAGTRAGMARRTQYALGEYIGYLSAKQPDAVLVLGDRYEIFAAGQAAGLLDIPLVHISGGDVTFGADDDWFRHCLTKMAKLHFTSCEEYRARVLRMGEEPGSVFNVGGLGDENIRSLPLLGREELAESTGLPLTQPYALVTFHPETATGIPATQQVGAVLDAMRETPGLFYLITGANADAGGREINSMLADFCAQQGENAAMVQSLGVLRYLSAMKYAALVLGNSSSGVVETPSFGVPTVDIGARQQGRATGANVVHAALDTHSIKAAMQRALAPEFAAAAKETKSPYRGEDPSGDIVRIMLQKLDDGALQGPKAFYDGDGSACRLF